MKIAFAGTPEFAAVALQRLLEAGHQVPLVLTQPDRPAGRGMKLQASPVKQEAERRGIPQVTFSLDMRLGARAGFKRNERMLSLDPRYVVAFPGNGVLERLVIEAKSRRITVVDRRGPLGTSPKRAAQDTD